MKAIPALITFKHQERWQPNVLHLISYMHITDCMYVHNMWLRPQFPKEVISQGNARVRMAEIGQIDAAYMRVYITQKQPPSALQG